MSGNTKKELILCDYCQIEKDGNQIYTARKQFAGCKIIDILQQITQRTISHTTPIKLCSLCASTLHATTGTIAKAIEVVDKLMLAGKKKTDASVLEIENDLSRTGTNNDSSATKECRPNTNGSSAPRITKTSISTSDKPKETTVAQPSPKKLSGKAKQTQPSTPVAVAPATPKKQQSVRENAEDSLKDAIKLTPAKDVPQKNKDFIQLFGPSADNATDSEDEEEDDDDVVETVIERSDKKNIAIDFECKLCDFTSTYPNPMKKHMKDLHGQKRPRIYNCLKCPKSFGVIKSLKTHLLTHGLTEYKEEKSAPEVPLAILTALKPQPKPVENVLNSEYTFAIKDSNSSTPKPAAGEQQVQSPNPTYVCEICQQDLKTVRSLKQHLMEEHGIERPKAFKCDACDAHFMHKVTMSRHYKKKHGEEDGVDTAPSKITARRKTIAIDLPTTKELTSKKKEATKQPTALAKIRARRTTVAADLSGLDVPANKTIKKTPVKVAKKLVEDTDDVIEVPVEIKVDLSVSPKKEVKLPKSPAVDKVAATPKKQMNPTQVLKTSFGLDSSSPSENKSEASDTQVTASPIKLKSKAVEELSVILATPSKKDKSKKKAGTDTLDSSMILSTDTPGNKSKVHTEDSSQISANTNGTPKKSLKRKVETQSEQETSQAETAEEGELDETFNLAKLKPVRKSKSGKRKQLADSDLELLDEVNPNVKPHKRAKLGSMELSDSELSCSVCNKVVGTRKRLDSHMHKKHATQLKCPICKVLYTDSMEYIRHFAKCDSDAGLPCGIKKCTKVFSAANFLSNHLNKKQKINI